MSISLSDLVSQLKLIVLPSSSNPTDAQYESAVKEAVLDYGRRAGVRLLTTINIVSGTATYALPDDFIRISQFPDLKQLSHDGVILSGTGIIPTAGFTSRERYAVRNKQLTISPTPTYSMDRPLWYVAGFPLDADAYADMTDDDVVVLLHKAAELILMQIADGVARHGWTYSIGDESVNKTTLAQTIRDQAAAERATYEDALKSALSGGAGVGTRATYTASEYGSFGEDA
jgi:hypothetical protein